ncbi:MAG: hypothetical protein JWN95_1114 [Frankiales bacterium]|nr:hypothetical protein [Frankiales bacterium]
MSHDEPTADVTDHGLHDSLVRAGADWRETAGRDAPPLDAFLARSIGGSTADADGFPAATDVDVDVDVAVLPVATPMVGRRRSRAKFVATLVGVAAVAIPIIIVARSSISRSPAPPSAGTAIHTVPTPDPATASSNQAAAAAAVQDTFRKLILPAGADPAATAPVPALAYGDQRAGWTQDRRWWKLSQSMNQAFDFFDRNVPDGLTKSGTASRSDHGIVTTRGLILEQDGQHAGYSNLRFQLTIAADGARSAIRVDVQAMALAVRPAVEHIALPVSSVELSVTRSSAKTPQGTTQRRSISGNQAQELATMVNGLVAMPANFTSTGVAFATVTRLVFATTGAPVTVEINGAFVSFAIGTKQLAGLTMTPELANAISTIVGPPG